MPKQTRRHKLELMRQTLEDEQSSFKSHWRELSDNILPRRARFFLADANRGDRRNQRIIDSTATQAARSLASGMMAGITSPARPWFRLTTVDPGLADLESVKFWLHTVTRRMHTVFLRSNVYKSLPLIYKDMGVFGTAAMFVAEDLDTSIRTYVFPIGSYMIALDSKQRVRIFMRKWRMTVRQLVEEFGVVKDDSIIEGTFSSHVKGLWENNQRETWIDVCHAILPNWNFDPRKVEAKYKRFASITYEIGSTKSTERNYIGPENDLFLRDSGFDIFRVLAPRWEVSGEDVYATTCPGMDGLGDIKQLQMGEKRGNQAIEKMVKPPLVGPTSLKNRRTSLVPGDLTYSDEREGQKGLRPIHEVDPKIQELEMKQEQIRQRIKKCFHEDIFRQIIDDHRRQRASATEIDEVHDEKLMALGPVLQNTNDDLLDPLIDITFHDMAQQGDIPPPPEELAGQELKVEYISVLAQAQKSLGLGSLERFGNGVIQLAAGTQDPSKLDKVNTDKWIDEYGDGLGIAPGIVRDDETVAAIREGRAKAAAAQAQTEGIATLAGAAKDLSGASLEGDNALKRVVEAPAGAAPAEA